MAHQLKICELCEGIFQRPVPPTAKEGIRICPVCVVNPPVMDEDELPPVRTFHVTLPNRRH